MSEIIFFLNISFLNKIKIINDIIKNRIDLYNARVPSKSWHSLKPKMMLFINIFLFDYSRKKLLPKN